MKWLKEVILAPLSPNIIKASIAEFFGHNVQFGLALFRMNDINNAFDSGFDIVGRLNMKVYHGGLKILVTVGSVAIRRALTSVCPRLRWNQRTP